VGGEVVMMPATPAMLCRDVAACPATAAMSAPDWLHG